MIVNFSKGELKWNFLAALPSAVLHRWIFSSCVESNLVDHQHCKMDYVTVSSAKIVPPFLFFFQCYRESKAGETNKEGSVKQNSVCSDGPRLCGGGPPGGGLCALLVDRLFAQEFMRLLALSHDFHSYPTFNNHRVGEMNCLDFLCNSPSV